MTGGFSEAEDLSPADMGLCIIGRRMLFLLTKPMVRRNIFTKEKLGC